MASWKPYRVTDAITDIESEKFVLPVIQRRLVWDEEKMELLFDTLLRGDSFGGIMVIEEEKGSKPLFNFRPFTRDGAAISSREVDKLLQSQLFVIDGQQRLQTFYIGLRGSFNGKVLYFDLYSDYNSEFEFKFESDASKLPVQSKDNTERPISDHNWYLASVLLNRLKDTNDDDQVASEIIVAQHINDESRRTHINKNVRAFYRNVLSAETIGISKVVINKTYDETSNKQRIVELFRRLNDGGTKLSPYDLVASILKGFSWEMEGFLEETLKGYSEIGLTQDNLIKLVFLLQDNHKKEMASIESQDADFAIRHRERIACTLKSVRDFLIYSELYQYYKEASRSFIPLFFVAYHLFHKKLENKELATFFDNFDSGNPEFPKMKQWVYHSLLNGVFRSRGAGWIPYKTGIRKILGELQKHKDANFPLKELIKVYTSHPLQFYTEYAYSILDQLDRSFVFYLMYDCKEIIRSQDIDHVMPKSILEAMKFDSAKINSVNNFQLLDFGTNRWDKSAKPFRDWFNSSVVDRPSFVKRHLIPPDEILWDETRFLDFAEARSKLILEKIKAHIV